MIALTSALSVPVIGEDKVENEKGVESSPGIATSYNLSPAWNGSGALAGTRLREIALEKSKLYGLKELGLVLVVAAVEPFILGDWMLLANTVKTLVLPAGSEMNEPSAGSTAMRASAISPVDEGQRLILRKVSARGC